MFIKKHTFLLGFTIVIALSLLTIIPFFSQGFFPVHDDTQVERVFEMGKALIDGMFPVRWVSDLGYGYGYPIFNFYAPLAYYFGGIFVAAGFSALLSTKIMMVAGILLAGLSMYLLGAEIYGIFGGIIAGISYEFALYHAVDIYVRGDVAEFWAYAFIPLVFLGIYKLFKLKKKLSRWVGLTSLSYAAIILSHNLTALMITPFIFGLILILIFILKKKQSSVFYILFSIALGITLSTFYWLPVLAEMKYTNVLSQIGGGADFHKNFICPIQLWYSQWGYGGSGPNCNDGFSFMFGKVSIFFSLLGLIGLLIKKETKKLGILLGAGGIISIFLTLKYSQFIWDIIKPMAFFQYPWRFLLMADFFLALLTGGIISLIKGKINTKYIQAIAILVILFIVIYQVRYFVPQRINLVTDSHYLNKETLLFITSKVSDEYMPKNFSKPKTFSNLPKSTFLLINPGSLKIIKNTTQAKIVKISTLNNNKVYIANAYFPSWHTYLDGKEVPFIISRRGLFVNVPKGFHELKFVFISTLPEKIGNIVSFTGLLILILGIIYQYVPKKSLR